MGTDISITEYHVIYTYLSDVFKNVYTHLEKELFFLVFNYIYKVPKGTSKYSKSPNKYTDVVRAQTILFLNRKNFLFLLFL